MSRSQITITGIVQGVGFRPFVFRLATELGLTGWVSNSSAGVIIEAQSNEEGLADFCRRLQSEAPPLAAISSFWREPRPDVDGEEGFSIRESSSQGRATAQIAPDAALCHDCLRELLDPADRRYRYPFITCTNCGPRYSIITGIPYDRPKTTMAAFPMCPDCRQEYHDPRNRRFHAQPNACPVCGPRVQLRTAAGELLCQEDAAIRRSVELLQAGRILAVKGLGGYHLAVDACRHEAVQRLRRRKQRDEKPFAVMAADLATAHSLALISAQEQRLLTGAESPIVIVRQRSDSPLSALVAPGNGWLGLMLPYTPLHHLLFNSGTGDREPGTGDRGPGTGIESPVPGPASHFTALVMTSANLSDEPIAFEDNDALLRLGGMADYFLSHNRPIHIPSDDSVMRVFQERPLFYRRSRGYAPRPVRLPVPVVPILAVGAELKSAVCLARGDQAFLSQHIGDLQNTGTCDSFRHIIRHLSGILEIRPELIACDQHPDYLSSLYAARSGLPVVSVQHHHAHLAACMAENGLEGDVIGLIFDGTGYGSDGTIWGGEFLTGGYDGFRRAGHFRPLALPGGDAAVREPWRMALSCLYHCLGQAAFSCSHPLVSARSELEKELLAAMLARGINSPLTSSCGRLFDAVAALLNLRQIVSYDGQAAIELEALAESCLNPRPIGTGESYPFSMTPGMPLQLDFTPLFPAILDDLARSVPTAAIAYRFHATLAVAALEACLAIADESGLERVVLSGGVFQNRLLSEMIYTGLLERGLQVFTHRLVPHNDGGLALGQIAIAGRRTS